MIDLSPGDHPGGVITLRSGQRFYSAVVGPDDDGDYVVRIEDGEHWGYSRAGQFFPRLVTHRGKKRWARLSADKDEWPQDIVAFERCSDEEARARIAADPSIRYGLYG